MVEIIYCNKKVKSQCTSLKEAKKAFDQRTAIKLLEKINFIEAADSLESIINYRPMHFHSLKGDRQGVYSIDINGRKGSYRLLLSFEESSADIFTNAKTIALIRIEEVSNHYE